MAHLEPGELDSGEPKRVPRRSHTISRSESASGVSDPSPPTSADTFHDESRDLGQFWAWRVADHSTLADVDARKHCGQQLTEHDLAVRPMTYAADQEES